jgi:hypothetical protein
MRPPSTRFLLALPSIVSLATLSFSPFARAQTDSPAAPLPSLPVTPPASPQPTSPPAPPPTPIPPAPPPVETSASPASATNAEPVVLALTRYRHQGFYLGVNSGIGFLSARGSGPRGDASISGFTPSTGDLSIGGTIAPGLVLGGVARAWSANGTFNGGPVITATTTTYVNGAATPTNRTLSGRAQLQSVELGAFLDWYPNPEKGWHVGVSLGLAGMTLTDDAGTQLTAGGIGGSIFGGHQWWLGPSWSLGLGAVLSIAGMSHLDDSQQNDSGYKLTPMGVGLQTQLLYY